MFELTKRADRYGRTDVRTDTHYRKASLLTNASYKFYINTDLRSNRAVIFVVLILITFSFSLFYNLLCLEKKLYNVNIPGIQAWLLFNCLMSNLNKVCKSSCDKIYIIMTNKRVAVFSALGKWGQMSQLLAYLILIEEREREGEKKPSRKDMGYRVFLSVSRISRPKAVTYIPILLGHY